MEMKVVQKRAQAGIVDEFSGLPENVAGSF
jgi:hypothetical protein